jgi:mevalonate kinase
MSRSNPLFYGKILLFGEYGIIKDSMGLSIPHTYYKGAFQFEPTFNEEQSKSNENLFKYLAYLKGDEAPCRFNTAAFENDLNNGLYFDSSIPQGFRCR